MKLVKSAEYVGGKIFFLASGLEETKAEPKKRKILCWLARMKNLPIFFLFLTEPKSKQTYMLLHVRVKRWTTTRRNFFGQKLKNAPLNIK